jgi:DNA-binding transcriptional ArsR family regulator
VLDVAVIDDPAAAEASLDPMRARLLSALVEPGSASTLAAKAGVSRQRLNYHLRELERHGLIELVEERRKGNCTERILRAKAASYVISPAAFAAVAPDPSRAPDRVSAYWMLSLAGQLVRDVGDLIAGATRARKPVATFAIDSEIRFASAADRAAFAKELGDAIGDLVERYHDGSAESGRDHRLVVALHPSITRTPDIPTEEQ